MSKIYANPFSWGEPVGGSHYVARPLEERKLQQALEKQVPFILSGLPGCGKTSFVLKVLHDIPIPSIYFDLTFLVCREDLVVMLLDALKAQFPLTSADPRITDLSARPDEAELMPIMDVWYEQVQQSSKKLIMVWDGFHHLQKLKDGLLDELTFTMRDRRRISHVFISHREEFLRTTFDDHKDPIFYQREFLPLGSLDSKGAERYLASNFRRMGLSDVDLPAAILKISLGQAKLTQKMAHALAQLWLEGNTTRLLERTLSKMLMEHNGYYTASWSGFGLNDRRLILGLASGYSRPTELGFIRKFGLSATSTAHNTVMKLLHAGWVVALDEGYQLYDPLFQIWVRKKRGLDE